jgi:hypothetical protein
MKALMRIVNIVEYGSKCITAISKGLREVVNNWPSDSPFGGDTGSSDSADEPKQES